MKDIFPSELQRRYLNCLLHEVRINAGKPALLSLNQFMVARPYRLEIRRHPFHDEISAGYKNLTEPARTKIVFAHDSTVSEAFQIDGEKQYIELLRFIQKLINDELLTLTVIPADSSHHDLADPLEECYHSYIEPIEDSGCLNIINNLANKSLGMSEELKDYVEHGFTTREERREEEKQKFAEKRSLRRDIFFLVAGAVLTEAIHFLFEAMRH